jgi:hypothetical protein
MARIRSIKPTFFTNEDLAELSRDHRLCFIGLWTQADREGRLEDRPRRLKAALFPYDTDVNIDQLIAGLAEKGFVLRYDADGVPAIQIVHFLKHQRPKSDEHASVIAAPLLADPRGIRTVPRLGDRKEEVGKQEIGGEEGADGAPLAPRAEDFVELWNATTRPPIPQCRDLTAKRRRHLRARLTERPMSDWAVVIARIAGSLFCRGQVPPRREGEQPWVATFDWLIGSPDSAVKVMEGAYDDRVAAKASRPFSATEVNEARAWRRGIGGCGHDPICQTFDACIAKFIRTRRGEAA